MNHPALREDEEFVLPCCEAVLAGTLALMTGHAQATCAAQRMRMAGKIASNLSLLGRDPALSASFRLVVQRMQEAWDTLAGRTDERLWHAARHLVQ